MKAQVRKGTAADLHVESREPERKGGQRAEGGTMGRVAGSGTMMGEVAGPESRKSRRVLGGVLEGGSFVW